MLNKNKNSEHKRILPFKKTLFYLRIFIPYALGNLDQRRREYRRRNILDAFQLFAKDI